MSCARAAEGELPALKARHAQLDADQERLADEFAVALAHESDMHTRLQLAKADSDALHLELADARAGFVSVRERQAALLARAVRDESLADALRELTAAKQARTAAMERAHREAVQSGFEDLAHAAIAVLTQPVERDLQQRCDTWLQQSQALHAAATAAEFDGWFACDADSARASAEQANQHLADLVERADQHAAAAERARVAVDRFAQRLADVDQAVQDYELVAAQAEPVLYLSRLTRGMTGQRRVALTTFVLRHWFEQVVQAANVRLLKISSGRYELIRVDEGMTKAELTGLTLQVLDRHTGEARSARSLSGGETFYTSLALALGLADVVRAEAGGVDLDTLFIDEGFGSLDADTLDEVMAVIEDLRDRGRVVGIVSHLTDLKDLIHERIEVRRLSDGSSTLRVVA